MNVKFAGDVTKAAFATLYPDADLEEAKEAAWHRQRMLVAEFPNLKTDAFWHEMVTVIFYSGFRAATVTAKKEVILKHLGDYKKVAVFNNKDVSLILADSSMIRNKRKIRACVYNAKVFLEIEEKYGSFVNYLMSFNKEFPEDDKNLEVTLAELQNKFDFLAGRTSRHFLLNFGFPLVKPDRMVMRLLARLGLIGGESDEYLAEATRTGVEMARKVGIPPRFMDNLLVGIGQSEGVRLCRKDNPLCKKCELKPYCHFFTKKGHEKSD
jgi:DNA-3-methyladenine glycosylase I